MSSTKKNKGDNEKKGLFKKISTPPHYESYSWGAKHSLIAKVVYWCIYVFRFTSLLQLLKALQRNKSSKINDSKERVDIHARDTEYYLLAVFSVSAILYFLKSMAWINLGIFHPMFALEGLPNLILTVYLCYFLFESIVWVFYYLLFRILIEKHLSIFNEAEYFITLPLVLASQFFLIASIIDVNVSEVIATILNFPAITNDISANFKLTLSLLGYMYTVLIIANIINLIPAIPVRRRPNITIIGAGDVVQKRMLPALKDRGFYSNKQIAIASDTICPQFKQALNDQGIRYFDASEAGEGGNTTKKIVDYIKKSSSYAVIATPTAEHITYIDALSKEGIVFGVEKPIVGSELELIALADNVDTIMSKGFLFSYYWLEKAIALNYFLSLNPNYNRFVNISIVNANNEPLNEKVAPSTLAYIQGLLGEVKKIDITFLEDIDKRDWALKKETGGFYYETLVHPITLLANILKTDVNLSELKSEWYLLEDIPEIVKCSADELGASLVRLSGTSCNCEIDILAGKFTNNKKRCMDITYEHGSINMNLDTLVCTIELTGEKKYSTTKIEVKSEFGGSFLDTSKGAQFTELKNIKYSVQMTLFDLFISNSGDWGHKRFDDYPNQVHVLKTMANFLKDDKNYFYKPTLINKTVMANTIASFNHQEKV